MSAQQPHDLDLPLSFLSPGLYTATLWKDDPDAESNPNHLSAETLNLSPADALKVHLALDGGFVAEFVAAGN